MYKQKEKKYSWAGIHFDPQSSKRILSNMIENWQIVDKFLIKSIQNYIMYVLNWRLGFQFLS